MQNLIVLGYVPGTNIQITFGTWLVIVATTVFVGSVVHGRHQLKAWVLSKYVNYLIKHRQLA